MTDIIIQLRDSAHLMRAQVQPSQNLLTHAADEIEKLRRERDAAVARYRHVIEILRRDGYWAALMDDAEIDAQVDAARGGA